jgi:hypothetical protein
VELRFLSKKPKLTRTKPDKFQNGTVVRLNGYIWVKRSGHFHNFGNPNNDLCEQWLPNCSLKLLSDQPEEFEVLGMLKDIILEIEEV